MILEAKDIVVSFKKERQERLFGKERQRVLNHVSLTINKGESFALVGESGSGKSTLGRVICGLLEPDSGTVTINGLPIYEKLDKEEKALLKHKISIVFQDYTSSVNPRFRVRDILWESLRTREKIKKEDAETDLVHLLEQVGLDEKYLPRYPHELSGGQLQRVCIARAIAIQPEFIILDEAISSLDASTQTQVMDLLLDLQKEYQFSYLFITHDLTAVTYMCDRVAFFYQGDIIEQVDQIENLPYVQNEYAKKLLDSVLGMDADMM